MEPAVFLIALLSVLGAGVFTVITVARLITARKSLPGADVTARIEELEQGLESVQHELAATQERLDFAERLLSKARDERQLGK